LNVFRIYAETEMSPWLREIKVPCLVLTGELDGGCNPRLNRQIAEALVDAELVILDGLKHAILIEAPERVAAPVLRYLKAHRGSSWDEGAPDCGHRGRYDDGRVRGRTSTRHGGVENRQRDLTANQGTEPMEIRRSGSQPSGKGPQDYFTGTVRIDPLFTAADPAPVGGASVTLEPGARTPRHTHPLGHTLLF